jgi:hypothetical protein
VGGAGGRDARSGPSGRFVFLSLLLLFWVAGGWLRVDEQRALFRKLVLFVRKLVLIFELGSSRLQCEIVKGGCDRRDDSVDRYLSMFAQKYTHLVSLVDCCGVELFLCVVCVLNQKCFCPVDGCGPLVFDVHNVFSSGGQAGDGGTCRQKRDHDGKEMCRRVGDGKYLSRRMLAPWGWSG